MSRRNALRWAATSTRLVVGAGLGVGIVLVIGLGVAAPWPGHERDALAIEVTPTAADTLLACTGDLIALGRDETNASGLSIAAQSAVVADSAGAALEIENEQASPPVAGSEGAAVLRAAPADGARSDAAGAGSAAVDDSDLRGFAAAACQPPLIESWLVAGATTTGSADLILLSNPTDVVATVDLTLYSATGAVTPPSGAALRVDAHSQRVVPLAGLAVGEGAPIVRVTASGAPVAAALQSSLSRTLLPGGVDQTGVVAGAASSQIVPGVRVPQSAVDAADAGATTLLRLLSPVVDTTARITVHGVDGDVALTQEVPLAADMPTEVDLAGLAAGTYSVEITTAASVVAAVWQTTGFGENSDFAWYASAAEISASTLVAVPEGPSPQLVLAASATGTAQVRLEPLDGGQAQTVTVTAGETAEIPVTAGIVYRLETGSPVHAAVSYLGDGAIAGFPIWPSAAAASAVTVHP